MNNRNSGRRRGRGGRPNNRGPNDGNRQQNRSPGNAHQLCEKYKSMARDMHQQGDRVMNEYYLQFADHYFRVLTEFNAKKDEQRKERDDTRDTRPHNRNQGNDGDQADNRSADNRGVAKAKSNDGAEDEKAPKKRQPRTRKKADDTDQGESNGEKIEADRLPGAIAIGGGDDGDGKTPAKRTRRKPKSDDSDGASAEAS